MIIVALPREDAQVKRILSSWKTPLALAILGLGAWGAYAGGLFGKPQPAPAPPPAIPAYPFDDETWRNPWKASFLGIQVPPEAAEFNNAGAELANQRKLKEAAEKFRAALAKAPGYPMALQNLVVVLADSGDPDGIREATAPWHRPTTSEELAAARDRFEAMGKEAEAHERRLVAMAIVGGFETKKDFPGAFQALKPLAERETQSKTLPRRMAVLADKAGLFSEAVDWAETALARSWDQPDMIAILRRIAEKDKPEKDKPEKETKRKAARLVARYELRKKTAEGKLTPEDLKPKIPGPPKAPGEPEGMPPNRPPGFNPEGGLLSLKILRELRNEYRLITQKDRSVKYLHSKLMKRKIGNNYDELILQLDNDEYERREKAYFQLSDAGVWVEPHLRKAMGLTLSEEARDRVNALLNVKYELPVLDENVLKRIKSLYVLWRINTSLSMRAIEEIARSSPSLREKEECERLLRLPREKTE